jgi:hypothetical protein
MDSGYSLDNNSPSAPASVSFNSGILSWDASGAGDFDYFSVYGSSSGTPAPAMLAPAALTLIGQTKLTTMDVTAYPYAYYHITATDFSGNEGPATIVSSQLTGIGDPPARYALDVDAYPNPFNPGTTVRHVVPSKGADHDRRI